MVLISTKQVKIFNKTLKEFVETGNFNVDKIKCKSIDISTFNEEVKQNIEDFSNCHTSVFQKITLLHFIGTENFNWEFPHNLFVISEGSGISKEMLEKLENGRKNQSSVVKKPVGPSLDPTFANLLNDIAGNVAKSLEGKDLSSLEKIDPQELLSGLMSGNNTVGGIDFSQILESSKSTMQNKVKNGEIDLNQLQGSMRNLFGALQNH
jgi:hypothetical protein